MADTNNKTSQSKMGGGGSFSGGAATTPPALAATYPVNTLMELKLSPSGTTVRGLVYCTDEFSNTIVLKKSLVHTTLSSEITVINAASVTEKRNVMDMDGGRTNKKTENEESLARELADVGGVEGLKSFAPPNVSRKALEERERRAIRLAEESFSHINQKASPAGKKIFDKLLKACNEVVWKGESILVLKEIRVDPPYTADKCSLINTANSGGLGEHSLERVKKIVMAAAASSSSKS